MKYQDAKVDDLLGTLIDYRGKTPPKTESGIPLITAKVIKGGRILDGNHEYIAEDYYDEWMRRGLPHQWDVLITTEAPLGEVAILKSSAKVALAQRVILLRGDKEKVNQRYLCFALQSPLVQARLNARATGATVAGIKQSELREVLLPVYPLPIQHRIASILSAYDDLIENNTRRIAILEEMARRIYEEWFVRFRFPGHEQVKMVESEQGLIPEGWSIQPLGNLLEHHIGGGWGEESESEDFPVAAYVIRGTDIPDVRVSALGRSPLRHHKESNFRTRKLQPKDIVFEVSGGSKDQPVGRAVLLTHRLFQSVDQPIICASFCRLVRANQKAILPELLQLHFERIYENREIMKYQTQSTGITNFKFTVFLEKEMVLVPPSNLQEHFSKSVLPLYDMASNLGVKNTNLRATRDLLLPKLISGELDVSTLPEPEETIAA